MSICAEEAGKDACQGDSGGPLVIPEPGNGRYALVGVVRSEHETEVCFSEYQPSASVQFWSQMRPCWLPGGVRQGDLEDGLDPGQHQGHRLVLTIAAVMELFKYYVILRAISTGLKMDYCTRSIIALPWPKVDYLLFEQSLMFDS